MNNLIPQAAIEKALEGKWLSDLGYQFEGYNPVSPAEVYFQSFSGGELHEHTIALSAVALDAEFWKALGNALEWFEGSEYEWEEENEKFWLGEASRFTYLVLTGGNTEAYWTDLLK